MNLIAAELQADDVVVSGTRDQGNAIDGVEKGLRIERHRRGEAFWYHAVVVRELPFDQTRHEYDVLELETHLIR